jgi:hypothetical protein
MAFSSGGAFKPQKTTPLLTIAEGGRVTQKEGSIDYHPPAN